MALTLGLSKWHPRASQMNLKRFVNVWNAFDCVYVRERETGEGPKSMLTALRYLYASSFLGTLFRREGGEAEKGEKRSHKIGLAEHHRATRLERCWPEPFSRSVPEADL